MHRFDDGHHGACVASRNYAIGHAIAHQPGGHADGTIAFLTHRLGGAVVHGDVFAGVMDLDRQIGNVFVLRELAMHDVLLADQNDPNA